MPMPKDDQQRHDMENVAPPPPPEPSPGDPTAAEQMDSDALDVPELRSIAGAASLYNSSWSGGDRYDNNCAHYLSDCFLRAGFDDLKAPQACVEARCGTTSKRPVRARDMWCWFKTKATKTSTTLPKNDGMWAVFQLKESEYWGGHVMIYDSDNNKYYGTGHYPEWDQYCYKW